MRARGAPWRALLALLAAAALLLRAHGENATSAADGEAAVLTAPVLLPATVLMCGAVPALEVLYVANPGGELVGVLAALLDALQQALCVTSYGYLYACEEFHEARRSLWAYLGRSVCGFPADAWNSSANVRDMAPAQAVEFLLSQCVATFTGDLGVLVQEATAEFMALSSRARSDVSAVLRANALKAGVVVASSSAVQDPRVYPPIFPHLAPVPTVGRQPAVATGMPPLDAFEFVPSNAALFDDGVFAPYAAAQAAGPFPDLSPDPDATSQFPEKLAAVALEAGGGVELYTRLWLAHPSPDAHFLTAQCATAAWDDDACNPVVRAAVGVTHDAYGNRLLSDRGQPLPAGTLDAAGVVPPFGLVVPPGVFTAPTLYVEDA